MKTYRVICTVLLTGLLFSPIYSCKKEAVKTAPAVTISSVTNIMATSASSGGTITADGGAPLTARGVCWSISQNPTISDSKTNDGTGTGSFSSLIAGLTQGTTYYIRAYATNSVGTGYSSQLSFATLALAPVITTADLSAITTSTATGGGNITNDGGSPVTARGVCWSTSSSPTTSSSKTTNGTGSGSFTSSVTGLTPGATYYIRAYATNSVGTSYGNELTFTTASGKATMTTAIVSGITSTTAVSGGNITDDAGFDITARGVCWSTTSGPTATTNNKTTDGTGKGSFISSITGLTPGMTYYVRAYATNSITTTYGNEFSFSALAISPPVLTTATVSAITGTTATSGGNITNDGGSAITARGVCWSISSSPLTSNSTTTDGAGSGSFPSSITGLTAGTTYYVRAYATNSAGTAYGNELTFTTLQIPTLSTTIASSISATSATSGGNISSNGGATITLSGVCWSTSSSPNTSSSKTTDGSVSGSFTSPIPGLTPGTTYYVRAYATNSVGTAYGNEVTFTTTDGKATLTTATISGLTSTSASSGGNITNDGGYAITARGVCWSTTTGPTTSNSKTTDSSGMGDFVSSISGLSPGMTYYVRAYATNSITTSYGNEVSFSALAVLPTLVTSAVSIATTTSATGGGIISSDGGGAVTTSGVCWSTSQDPTTSGNKSTDGAGSGSYTSTLTGLTPGTTYYIRAYATNSAGTAYGNQITFKFFVIGDSYQGGLIAYIFFSGDPGYVSGEVHGLITAVNDQSTGIRWYNGSYVSTGASGTILGTGFTNTNAIIAVQGAVSTSYAAGLARAYTVGGNSDWSLPSRDELSKLYEMKLLGLGGFANDLYFSSSEYSSSAVWYMDFSTSEVGPVANKSNLLHIRAIRYF